MARIGVFVCHCGENIARTVRVKDVAAAARRIPGVVVSTDYKYLCSAPGQKIITDAVTEHGLTGVVVSACSPQLHEPTFRRASAQAGLNPFQCEMANIREQCSWVHPDPSEATPKATQIVASMVEKVKQSRPLRAFEVPITKRALVIGGGVAGIRTALDIANAGHSVVLVEREPSIGGNMARLSETFPTLDCSQCILTPLTVEVLRHPNIELLTYAEVEAVSGYVGNFRVRITKKPRYVSPDLCTACGDCVAACPVDVPSDFDRSLAWRKAIYIPFPQAVPTTYTLDAGRCLNARHGTASGYRVLACERCADACLRRAIDYDQKPEVVERDVGVIVAATGYQLWDAAQAPEYGYGTHPDIVDGLEFERLLSASGPTGGEVRRPSNGKPAKRVVMIQCVGSRDPRRGVAYCSRVCCMYTAKHALLYKHKVHDGQVVVFYMDIRAAGKGYEEFVNRVMEEERVLYLRGRVSQVIPRDGELLVFGADTLSGQAVQVKADLVVLATAVVPAEDGALARKLRISTDAYGFLQEAHPKLRPVETLTAGVFLAGAAQAPKDIPDTVAQASAAASKALELLSRPVLQREPTVCQVNEAVCNACFDCQRVCPYGAIERKELRNRDGQLVRRVAHVNPAMCEGCGACLVACRPQAIDLAGYSNEQIFGQLEALVPALAGAAV
ncbi:MAG: CoB--CoM heterodisulfide reductase iron-sulfur subunit A family protein [Candidatus Rokubacteria bacterium]|nr:CoB--CoM heterodisulfide reductase iron-sulfur subunit A family protein [Candidatus Rokubacteria bacterium]